MLEEDRTTLCGPRYAHDTDRLASRAGTVSSEVVLGGRKVAVRRPRVRAEGREVPLPTFQAMADVDPLNRRVVEQMLVGVATRRNARSLEPVPATMRSRGTSKSGVSRRFVTEDGGAVGGVADRLARRDGPGGAVDRRSPYRRALPDRGARHRG
jgi:putative transposase